MDIRTGYDVKDTVRIESTIELNPPFDDTTKTDPETVEITITNPDNTEDVTSESMTNHETGEYYYNWDTVNLDEGDYFVEVYAERASGESELEDFYIRLE